MASSLDLARASGSRRVELIAPSGIPLISPGDPIAQTIISTMAREGFALDNDDVVVIAQKIVSKSEDRYVDLRTVSPSADAIRLAGICGKDPRLVEVILGESSAVVRCKTGVIIVRHRLGLVLANAGIDHSNISDSSSGDRVLLLPTDPDASAATIKTDLERLSGRRVAVLIIDSLGRAWRIGTCGTCLGAAGFESIQDLRGSKDLFGQTLVSTIVGAGDELAAAASLLMGQAGESRPVVIAKGLKPQPSSIPASAIVRPLAEDLFT